MRGYVVTKQVEFTHTQYSNRLTGLALLFFLLSLTGNFTYGLSVFTYSQESDYLVKAVPWLVGSLGTIVEDCIIFYQFRIYSPKREKIQAGVNGTHATEEAA